MAHLTIKRPNGEPLAIELAGWAIPAPGVITRFSTNELAAAGLNAFAAELKRALNKVAKDPNVMPSTLQDMANEWRPAPPPPPKLSPAAKALLRALDKMSPEERKAEVLRLGDAVQPIIDA